MTDPAPEVSQEFFETRQAAAVLKHAILEHYLTPWAAKTGSASPGGRVAIIDGYAGAGRYRDGSPGSPAIIARLAAQPALKKRRIECHFVESDPATYDQLRTVLAEDAAGLVWETWPGGVEDHLTDLLQRTQGVPLFLFLDPFGHGLSFETIMTALEARPAAGAATEALIRIDCAAVFRTRGALHAAPYPGRDATLRRLDDTAGGTWWRDQDDPSMGTGDYLEWFMAELRSRACKRLSCGGWTVDVQRRSGRLPVYYLLFLTRHRDGMTVFNESLSLATRAWRRRILELSLSDTLLLDNLEANFASQEAELERDWQAALRVNVVGLLAELPSFRVFDQLERVLAGVLGLVRQKHLRVVLKNLHSEGVTTSDSKGDLYNKVIVRA